MNKLVEFSKEENTKLNIKLIEKAVTFAKKWHGTQMRKTGDHPFYLHPLKVAEMVAERYCKTDMAMLQYCMIQLRILNVLWSL